jgi:hypothetical protein
MLLKFIVIISPLDNFVLKACILAR